MQLIKAIIGNGEKDYQVASALRRLAVERRRNGEALHNLLGELTGDARGSVDGGSKPGPEE